MSEDASKSKSPNRSASKKSLRAESAAPGAQLQGMQKGIYIFKDNSRYDGSYRVDPSPDGNGTLPPVRHGEGRYSIDLDGSAYEGEWENDRMSGKGAYTFPSGAVYDGIWKDNQFQGVGRYSWPDGSSYQGEWQSSRMHGTGKYTDVQGEVWAGTWYQGEAEGLAMEYT